MNLVIEGMAEAFMVTEGFGDTSNEPPPVPPDTGLEDTLLGSDESGLLGANLNAGLEDG